MIAASLVFLAAYAWPILDPDLPRGTRALCATVLGVIWLVFVADYLIRLFLAEQRWTFVRTHLVDLASVAVPALRPLQLLRVLRILDRKIGETLRGRVSMYVGITSGLVVVIASLAVLGAEQKDPDATITAIDDAAWWCITTMTTVGYGDLYPVTGTGRLVAAALMVFGIGLLGIVTASMASYFVERFSDEEEAREEEQDEALRRELASLTEQVAALRAELTGARSERAGGDDEGPEQR